MSDSAFDILFHEFQCPSPKCGKSFKELLRSLLNKHEVVCPHCGTAIDIRVAKTSGKLGLDFSTAAEIDKKRNEKK